MRALRTEIEDLLAQPVAGRVTRDAAARQSQLDAKQAALRGLIPQQTAFSHESLAQFLAVAEAQRNYDKAVAQKDLYDEEIAVLELSSKERAKVRKWRADWAIVHGA